MAWYSVPLCRRQAKIFNIFKSNVGKVEETKKEIHTLFFNSVWLIFLECFKENSWHMKKISIDMTIKGLKFSQIKKDGTFSLAHKVDKFDGNNEQSRAKSKW